MKKMLVPESLPDKIRKLLEKIPDVHEKKMFGRIAFIVNGKLCITAGAARIILRIDPAEHEKLLQKPGTSTVVMKNRTYKGFIYVEDAALSNNKTLQTWIDKAMAFNAQQQEMTMQKLASKPVKLRPKPIKRR